MFWFWYIGMGILSAYAIANIYRQAGAPRLQSQLVCIAGSYALAWMSPVLVLFVTFYLANPGRFMAFLSTRVTMKREKVRGAWMFQLSSCLITTFIIILALHSLQ